MRKKFYELSAKADLDLEEIFEYTEVAFGLEQAIKYLEELDAIFEQLVVNSELGKKREEVRTGLRSFPKEAHVVFYRILPDRIRIVRVLHGSRDIGKAFKEK